MLLTLSKKLAVGPPELAFPREAFEQLCSLAWDEKLFRALTREVRGFFQEATSECSRRQPQLAFAIHLVELYFDACAKAALLTPFGCWAFCRPGLVDAAQLAPRIAYSLEPFDFESRLGYSGFLWFRPAPALTDATLLELSFKSRLEQQVFVGLRDNKLFARCGRQEAQVQLEGEDHLLAFCIAQQDGACQLWLDGQAVLRCERLLQGFNPVDSELRVALLDSFTGRLLSYYACYGCDLEASFAVHRELGPLGIQSTEQLGMLQRLLQSSMPHKIVSPVCESSPA